MSFQPTPQQTQIRDAYLTGKNLTIEAGAGSGKTSTLKLLGEATPNRKALYFAYNKAIQLDAERTMPRNVLSKTAHGLAFRTHANRDRLNGPRVTAREAARILRISAELVADDLPPLAPAQIARLTSATVSNFCYSADVEVGRKHVPKTPKLDAPAVHANVCHIVVPLARKMWADLTAKSGKLRYTHDVYLKSFCMSGPQLPFDVVFLDEAQDSNGCVAGLVKAQKNAQIILVGDRNQSIYGWRGAVDAMSNFDGDRYYLTKSFRFGPAVADEANKWLSLLGDMRIEGHEPVGSYLAELDRPDAVLCRTNARAVAEVLDAFKAGRRPALVGGGEQIKRLAEAAQDLQDGRGTDHPELFAFTSWGEVQAYVEQEADGSDLKTFVKLIDGHGADVVVDIMDRLYDEKRADVVVSTAHKSKGREWRGVQVASDFKAPKVTDDNPDGNIPRPDAMLAYVTVTRAMKVLDRGGLSYIDDYIEGSDPVEKSAREVIAEGEAILAAASAAPIRLETLPLPAAPANDDGDAGRKVEGILADAARDNLDCGEADCSRDHSYADLAEGFTCTGSDTDPLGAVVSAQMQVAAKKAAVKAAIAEISTCTCDVDQAKAWSELIGQAAGPAARHCHRCGGGRV